MEPNCRAILDVLTLFGLRELMHLPDTSISVQHGLGNPAQLLGSADEQGMPVWDEICQHLHRAGTQERRDHSYVAGFLRLPCPLAGAVYEE